MIGYEEKSLNAWPSLRTLVYKGCIIRLSNGYTKRANSANPLYIEDDNISKIIGFTQKVYSSFDQPAVFKIIDKDKFEEIDSTLENLNFKKIDTTNVMVNDLTIDKISHGGPTNLDINVDNKFTEEWIKSFIAINNIQENYKATVKQMLNQISIDLIVASIKENDKIIACGYGAIEDDFIGLYDIIVDEKYRGKGYGKNLVNSIINQAQNQNISHAYLQVVDTNNIAKGLYKSLGFKKLYNYWYRVK
jgi:GNAT superfamily N-acetyltransferase